MAGLVTVASFGTRIEAEIAKGVLEVNGIQSIIVADDAEGMRPFPVAYTIGVELKVVEAELEKAKEILKKTKENT